MGCCDFKRKAGRGRFGSLDDEGRSLWKKYGSSLYFQRFPADLDNF
jgi:hypothetical protein